jgi:hypothetical protein
MTDDFDFNNAPTQRSFDIIPNGTIATLHVTVRAGGASEGGWLTPSKANDSVGLDLELTVVGGKYAKRKFWTRLTVAGDTPGHAEAASISRRLLRAMLESARNIRPDDNSAAAMQARRVDGYGDFNNIRFVARIGVQLPQNGYPAKNVLQEAITPERADWRPAEQVGNQPSAATMAPTAPAAAAPTPQAAAPVGSIKRPAWAS